LADIGDRIRAERQARGWSVHRMSMRSGLPVITVKRLEAGSGSLRVFAQACKGLDVAMAYLLSEDWQMPALRPVRSAMPSPVGLSPRQAEVLREAASGDSLATIGGRLGLDPRAVGAALSRAYQRLGVALLPSRERRVAAVRVAVKHGLIDSEIRTS
jgi:DNA-binding CsgD family transcriptional regulator